MTPDQGKAYFLSETSRRAIKIRGLKGYHVESVRECDDEMARIEDKGRLYIVATRRHNFKKMNNNK